MPVDETLIIGHYGDESVFAVNVAPGRAMVMLSLTDEQDETVEAQPWQQSTDAFAALRDVLDRLLSAPQAASSESYSHVRL